MFIPQVNGTGYAYRSNIIKREQVNRTNDSYAEIFNSRLRQIQTSGTVGAAEKSDGRVIGMAMFPAEAGGVSYGMRARYAACSTPENPVVQVTSNYGGQTVSYNVAVNKVDPQNATQFEMFALCSYADDKGMGAGGAFGSYQKMKYYADNARCNGYFTNLGGCDALLGGRLNWYSMVNRMMGDYLSAGIYSQYHDGAGLLGMFNKIGGQSRSFML